jgi:hypothetical protein
MLKLITLDAVSEVKLPRSWEIYLGSSTYLARLVSNSITYLDKLTQPTHTHTPHTNFYSETAEPI